MSHTPLADLIVDGARRLFAGIGSAQPTALVPQRYRTALSRCVIEQIRSGMRCVDARELCERVWPVYAAQQDRSTMLERCIKRSVARGTSRAKAKAVCGKKFWVQRAVKKPGKLREMLGIPPGQPIPVRLKQQACKAPRARMLADPLPKDPRRAEEVLRLLQKRACLARTLAGFKKKKRGKQRGRAEAVLAAHLSTRIRTAWRADT